MGETERLLDEALMKSEAAMAAGMAGDQEAAAQLEREAADALTLCRAARADAERRITEFCAAVDGSEFEYFIVARGHMDQDEADEVRRITGRYLRAA